MAVDLAGRLHARLAVVHVVNLGDYPIDPDTPGWKQQARQTLADERRQVEEALRGHAYGWFYQAWHGSPGGT